MKKLICIVTALAAMSFCVFAQENSDLNNVTETEKVRLDLVVADTIGTNIISTTNTTTLGVRVGLNDNKVGLLAGAKIREGFCTADWEYGPFTDFYFNVNPYLGVELWNWELIGGVAFLGDFEISPYAAVYYNLDLIKQEPGFNDRLCMKFGVEYAIDQYAGKYGSHKDAENAGLGAAAVDVFSIMLPKVAVGIQYSFGWGF